MDKGRTADAGNGRRLTSALVAATVTLGVAGGLAALTTSSSNAATTPGCTAVY